MEKYKVIEVKRSIFADNDADAERLRGELKEKGTFLLNLIPLRGPERRRSFGRPSVC